MLAGGSAQCEEPLLGALQLLRLEVYRPQRRAHADCAASSASSASSSAVIVSSSSPGASAALRCSRRSSPASCGEGSRARQDIFGVAYIGGDLFRPHHAGALFGQRRFLAGLRLKLRQFVHGGAQVIRLAGGGVDARPVSRQLLIGRAPLPPSGVRGAERARVAAEPVEQVAVGGRIHQRPLVMLAVDLDQRTAKSRISVTLEGWSLM